MESEALMEKIRLAGDLAELAYPGSDLPPGFEKVRTAGSGSTGMPVFMACKQGGDFWISVRGAAEVHDFLLVGDFDKVDFPAKNPRNVPVGTVHKGVLQAARWIISLCRAEIDSATNIYCTGHSLGGATAAMIIAVLYLEEGKDHVFGFCSAPFPILTRNISDTLKNNIITIVFRNDLVPRLTQRNIAQIVRIFGGPQAISVISSMVQMWIQNIVAMQSRMGGTSTIPPAVLAARIPPLVQRLVGANEADPDPFCLPGNAYYIWMEDGVAYVRRFVDTDSAINPATWMMSMGDHNPDFYLDSIMQLDGLEFP